MEVTFVNAAVGDRNIEFKNKQAKRTLDRLLTSIYFLKFQDAEEQARQ